MPYVDTDIIVRLLTGDDSVKQQAARNLFKQVESGQLELSAPVTMIADAVYVLRSRHLYHRQRSAVSAALIALVRLPGFNVQDREAVLEELAIFGSTNLDFGEIGRAHV